MTRTAWHVRTRPMRGDWWRKGNLKVTVSATSYDNGLVQVWHDNGQEDSSDKGISPAADWAWKVDCADEVHAEQPK